LQALIGKGKSPAKRLSMIGEGSDQLGRHQLDGAGLLQGVDEKLGELVGCRPLKREASSMQTWTNSQPMPW
jgi:hypothetical protein